MIDADVQKRWTDELARGVRALESRAQAGDASARARLDDMRVVESAVSFQVGGTQLFVSAQRGVIHISAQPPQNIPIRAAIALSSELAEIFWDEVDTDRPITDADAMRMTRLVSKRVEDALVAQPLEFHCIFEGVPDLGTQVVRVGLGVSEPPEEPTFTAAIRWDDIEAIREGEFDPAQLLMSGRIRFDGDYARALAVAMQLRR